MANRYANLVGSKKISEDWQNINIGFDRVQADMDTNKGTADAHIANTDIHVTAAKKAEWDSKAPGSTTTDLAAHKADQVVHVTQADHDKLNGIQEGAQVNQNAFAKVNDIEAADPSDVVTIKGGVGITITTNPNSKEVEITATGDAAPGAHGPTHTEHGADPIPVATPTEGGIMSAAQAAELVAHDELLDEHAAAITALEDRLDTSDTDPVTLQPGLRVVKAAKYSRFRLGQIKGKSEINGQGRIGIIGVENPYVIGTSDNLLPPFYEWGHVGPGVRTVVNPYYLQGNSNGTGEAQNDSPDIPVTAGKYTLSVDELGAGGYLQVIQNGVVEFLNSTKLSATFTLATGTVKLRFAYTTASTVYIKNPMLVTGSTAKPFQPQRKSMLAFQTELHANPTDGSDPDLLFEQDGQYFKLERWKKVVLDGSLVWNLETSIAVTGFKRVLTSLSASYNPSNWSPSGTKYNGKILDRTGSGVDKLSGDAGGKNVIIEVPNADSGWGDSYTPTADEIKAYFMGWKMYDNRNGWDGAPYNVTDGSGDYKAWVKINKKDSSNVTATLPTSSYPEWTPYNLLYRLAKDTVDPIVSEGALLLAEGDNLIEVGTGIVLREHPPILEATGTAAAMGDVSAPTRYKIKRYLTAYKNDKPDYAWHHSAGNAYGEDKARILWADYNREAAYTLTYLKLDKSPIQPITGSLAANEKTQISDLTAGVAEALQRVSVVEQKKADEDAPGWITPTLLNGALQFADTSYGVVGYRKHNGLLEFRGLATVPVAGTIFRLATEHRPNINVIVSARTPSGLVEVRIGTDGAVNCQTTTEWVSLWDILIPLS